VIVAAAGNRFEDGNPVPYPAAYDGVIGVGAIGIDGRRVAGSQVGPYVDLVAPGAQVTTAALPRGLAVQDGTSFAAPFVAATAALLRQYHPRLTAAQVATRLIATADPAPGGPPSQEYGAGLLNPYRAVADRVGDPAAPAAPARTPPPSSAATNGAERSRALTLAGGGLAAACLVALAALIGPRGRRRRWRPGRTELPGPPPPQVDPAAPAFGEPPPHPRRP
jgi:subtilisin family serine protease